MGQSKIPTNLAKNASKLHKYIGELLTSEESPFKFFDIRQEYPVNKVNVSFPSGREKYDWVVMRIKVCIEIMGVQHRTYIPHFHKTIEDFHKQQERDRAKEQAAKDAGWAYVVIEYNEIGITIQRLEAKIKEALDQVSAPKEIIPLKPKRQIKNKGFKTDKVKYNWPKRKIQNRRKVG